MQLHLVHRGGGRRHVRDQVRLALVARLGQVDHVAGPVRVRACCGSGPPGRRATRSPRRPAAARPRPSSRTRPAGPARRAEVPLPDPAQHLDQRRRRGARAAASAASSAVEQGEAVLAHRSGRTPRGRLALRGRRLSSIAAAVPLEPLGPGHAPQPLRGDVASSFSAAAERLGQQLQAVQHADRGQDVGRVGALPAAGLDQPQRLAAAAAASPAAAPRRSPASSRERNSQSTEKSKPGSVSSRPSSVLPVDAGADGVGGPAVGEVLAELQDGDQGQPPGGQGGLAAVGEELGEVAVVVRRCRARRGAGGRGCPWGRRRGRRRRSARGRARWAGA